MVKLRPLLIKPAISRGERGYVVGGGRFTSHYSLGRGNQW